VPQDAHKIHVGLEKSLNLELGTYLDFQDLVSSVISNTTKDKHNIISDNNKGYTAIESLTVREIEANTRSSKSSKTIENSKDLHGKCPTLDCCSVSEGHKSIVREIHPLVRESCFIEDDQGNTSFSQRILFYRR